MSRKRRKNSTKNRKIDEKRMMKNENNFLRFVRRRFFFFAILFTLRCDALIRPLSMLICRIRQFSLSVDFTLCECLWKPFFCSLQFDKISQFRVAHIWWIVSQFQSQKRNRKNIVISAWTQCNTNEIDRRQVSLFMAINYFIVFNWIEFCAFEFDLVLCDLIARRFRFFISVFK